MEDFFLNLVGLNLAPVHKKIDRIGLLADTGAAGELELEEDLEDELEEEAKGRIKNSFSDNLASLVGMGFMQEEARRLQPPGPGGGLPGGRGAGRRPPARHRQPSRLPAGPARVPAHAGGAV